MSWGNSSYSLPHMRCNISMFIFNKLKEKLIKPQRKHVGAAVSSLCEWSQNDSWSKLIRIKLCCLLSRWAESTWRSESASCRKSSRQVMIRSGAPLSLTTPSSRCERSPWFGYIKQLCEPRLHESRAGVNLLWRLLCSLFSSLETVTAKGHVCLWQLQTHN